MNGFAGLSHLKRRTHVPTMQKERLLTLLMANAGPVAGQAAHTENNVYIYLPSLNPAQIPKIPPIAFPSRPEKENNPDPQIDGINPPIVLPINKPIQIKVFLLIPILYFITREHLAW